MFTYRVEAGYEPQHDDDEVVRVRGERNEDRGERGEQKRKAENPFSAVALSQEPGWHAGEQVAPVERFDHAHLLKVAPHDVTSLEHGNNNWSPV